MFFSLAPLFLRSDKAGVRGSRFGYVRASAAGAGPSMFFGPEVTVRPSATACPFMMAVRLQSPSHVLRDCLALVGFGLRGLGRAVAGLIEATYVGRRARASAARAGPSMFFGFDVKVRPPATACPLMMAA